MKGTDINERQMKAAEQFILDQAKGRGKPADGMVYQEWEQFVRLVAWYGAMRYVAGRDGINSLENPGVTYKVQDERSEISGQGPKGPLPEVSEV